MPDLKETPVSPGAEDEMEVSEETLLLCGASPRVICLLPPAGVKAGTFKGRQLLRQV